jgi:hypothetical protein
VTLKRKAPIQRGRMKRKSRSASEFQRIYGSKKRVEWIKAHGCLACARTPCENAHTENGGMGRKAGYETIVPLCSFCHHALHTMGQQSFEEAFSDMLCGRTLVSWATTYADAYVKFSGGAS